MSEAATAATRLTELEADNARLRRLLDARNAPGELRHRLRNTVGMLRVIIRASAEARSELDDYVAHLEDRLDTLARAQNAADQFGEVGLHGIIADELHHYRASEGEQVRLSGPEVFLQPHAAQVVTLAMHELAVNAVEHGPLMAKGGRIAVNWQVETGGADPLLVLTWKESGPAKPAEPARRGFGTEVLQHMLAYELKAATRLDFERDGLRCTISLPLPERVGRVASESSSS